MRSRKLLALLFCLITGPALAGYMTLLGAGLGAIQPAAQATFTNPSYSTNLSNLTSVATFSRAGNAMQFDSSGYLTYGPNNLLTQSNTFSNAAWTKSNITVASGVTDPLGGTNAFTLTATGVSAEIYQSVTGNTATNYVVSIWVRRRTGSGSVNLYKPDDGSYTAIGPSLTSNWQQFSTNGPGGASTAILDFVIQTSGDAVDVYLATVSAVTYETTARIQDQVITTSAAHYGPRFEYQYNGSSWVNTGLVVEPASATNYAKYSEALGSWTAAGGTQAANAASDPTGLSKASRLDPTGGSPASLSVAGYTATGSTVYTASIYAKSAGGAGFAGIGFYDGTNAVTKVAAFDLSTGANTFASVGITVAPATNVGNGWWRINATWTSAANTASISPVVYSYSSGLAADPTSADKVYFRAPQWENSGYPSSYIPNVSTGTTTRAPEIVQPTVTGIGASATIIVEGSFDYLNPSPGSVLVGAQAAFSLALYATTNTSTVRAYDTGNSRVVGDATTGSGTWATTARAGISVSPSGASLCMGGGTVVTTGTAFGAGAITSVYFGKTSTTAYASTYRYRSFAWYNSRLPDATLQQKSVVGASYAANDNGLRFADNDNLPIHWRVAL